MKTIFLKEKSTQSAGEARGSARCVAVRVLLLSIACMATGGCATNPSTAMAANDAPTPAYYQSSDNPYHAD
jgi:hypothetical protein